MQARVRHHEKINMWVFWPWKEICLHLFFFFFMCAYRGEKRDGWEALHTQERCSGRWQPRAWHSSGVGPLAGSCRDGPQRGCGCGLGGEHLAWECQHHAPHLLGAVDVAGLWYLSLLVSLTGLVLEVQIGLVQVAPCCAAISHCLNYLVVTDVSIQRLPALWLPRTLFPG